MQMVSEVMTRNVQFISPHENLQRAAQMMDELNVGALPVCDGERLVGMVTDRDITVRGVAAGRLPGEAQVEEVMSTDVRWCFEDQPLDDVMRQMADTQIRRVPVVSHDDAHRLVGIVSLGDLAAKTDEYTKQRDVAQLVEKVSTPAEPDRSQVQAGAAARTATTGVSDATGSDTGTATGFAGTAAVEALGENAQRTPGPARRTEGAAGNTGGTAGPEGIDAAGASGASGGTAGTAGSSGPDAGPRP
ncbi:MAG TPA: CBS domain-containing protein [Noviherbaspirillum sp.]|nr:CBS domain-containing protein [Noviherbaspirillum sp.]